jgi:hypothetical protein
MLRIGLYPKAILVPAWLGARWGSWVQGGEVESQLASGPHSATERTPPSATSLGRRSTLSNARVPSNGRASLKVLEAPKTVERGMNRIRPSRRGGGQRVGYSIAGGVGSWTQLIYRRSRPSLAP